MLKHSGCGHNPTGILNTQQGECVVLCLACPQPGKNLPDDWRTILLAKRYHHDHHHFHFTDLIQ
ncbi:hypothetical protein PAXRUDRAFT_159871 [Paxillus rubicundulus Ve08.2h10]|uniref:Uncharacterized protein n=1 Tax=Paxillus rubicundulus Ve08.2h10 TaxID=930991 RepID=A0A0D0CWS2_9AGAM|nr:hypothetical protein PAXRUDRAFT_159871 [Paxillus rubicundulus Ve08.2h10]